MTKTTLLAVLSVALTVRVAAANDGTESAPSRDTTGPGLFSVGLFAGGFFSSSDHEFFDRFTSQQQELKAAALDLGVRVGVMPLPYVGVEGEFKWIPTKTDGGQSAHLLGWGGHVLGQYPLGEITPFGVLGFGGMGVQSDELALGDDNDFVGYLGIGSKYALTPAWGLRVDLRAITAPKAGSDNTVLHYEALLGASFDFGRWGDIDKDGDGFMGSADRCPDQAGGSPDGCPNPDRDGDGIANESDRCPEEAETVNSFEDEDGCADEVPDADGDGINDATDSCKDQAEDMDGFQDEDGCPDEDNDEDGVADATDGCRDEKGSPENGGCPDTDRDGDTVVDRVDNCPDEAGTPENQGCKKKQLVVIAGAKLEILDKVYFTTGKAKIQSRSNALLRNVAQVMLNRPGIKKVEVGGHTDDIGDDEANKTLSQARAEAVVAFLVKEGVAADRLAAVGYGEERPAEEGTTRQARTANRRVEFKILDMEGPGQAPAAAPVPEAASDLVSPDEEGAPAPAPGETAE